MDILKKHSIEIRPLGEDNSFRPKNTEEALEHLRTIAQYIGGRVVNNTLLAAFQRDQLRCVKRASELFAKLEKAEDLGSKAATDIVLAQLKSILESPQLKWMGPTHLKWEAIEDSEDAYISVDRLQSKFVAEEITNKAFVEFTDAIDRLRLDIDKSKSDYALALSSATVHIEKLKKHEAAFAKLVENGSLEYSDSIKSALENSKLEIGAFKKQFEAATRFSATALFWRSKVRDHYFQVGGFFFLFAISIFLVAYYGQEFIRFHGSQIQQILFASHSGSETTFNLFPGVLIVTAFGVLVIWPLKHLSRLFLDNWALLKDAQQRSAMLQTYLALVGDPKVGITPEERILALNAMFRPSTSGGDDDSLPTSVVEYLTKLMDSRKP